MPVTFGKVALATISALRQPLMCRTNPLLWLNEASDTHKPSKIRDVNFSWRSKEYAVSALPSLLLFVVHLVIAALGAGRAVVSDVG
jgi:hypothetical protein